MCTLLWKLTFNCTTVKLRGVPFRLTFDMLSSGIISHSWEYYGSVVPQYIPKYTYFRMLRRTGERDREKRTKKYEKRGRGEGMKKGLSLHLILVFYWFFHTCCLFYPFAKSSSPKTDQNLAFWRERTYIDKLIVTRVATTARTTQGVVSLPISSSRSKLSSRIDILEIWNSDFRFQV